MITKRSILAACILVLAASSSGVAQIPGINVHLGARAGLFAPAGKIGEDISARESRIASGLAFGASVEFDIPLSPIDVRANLDAALGRPMEVSGQEVPGSDVDIIALTGDLVFRPVPRIAVFQPYLLAGAGIKRYSVEGISDPETDFTGHVGAGGDLRAGRLSLFGEVSDYISSFDGGDGNDHLQNDIFIMIGVRIGLL
jgi:hypothetical protein